MKNTINFLQRYRKGKKIMLKDMARIIGVNITNLSRIESGERQPSLLIIIAYHLVLQIPLELLFKKHFPAVLKECIDNAQNYKEELIDELITPDFPPLILQLDELIDHLTELEKRYEHSA